MGTGYNPKIVTDGLILYVDAANFKSYSTGATNIISLVNTNNQMVLANGASVVANNKGTLTLDGINDCVILNSNTLTDNLSSMTVSVWVYKDWANTTTYIPIVSKMVNFLNGAGWDMSWAGIGSSKRVSFLVQAAGGSPYRQYLTPVVADLSTQWYNFTACFNNPNDYSSYRMYIDGEFQSPLVNNSVGTAVTSFSTTANVCIGARNAGTTDNYGTLYFKGDVAVVQIYNRALSNNEISQNFNALRGRFGA